MIYVLAILGYVLVMLLLMRFFDVVHSWDEETNKMMEQWIHDMDKKAA